MQMRYNHLMIAFGHTAVGTLVGLYGYEHFRNNNLILGLGETATLGIISHYAADAIPHGHFFRGSFKKSLIVPVIIFDLGLSIVFFTWLTFYTSLDIERVLYVMAGIGGSQLPDVIDGLIYTKFIAKKGLLKVENDFHQAVHWHGVEKKTLLLGARDIWQVGVVLIAILSVIYF